LPEDVAQRADRQVLAWMRNGDVARLAWMFELPVIAFATNAFPAVGF
jgi:hypothetical protein